MVEDFVSLEELCEELGENAQKPIYVKAFARQLLFDEFKTMKEDALKNLKSERIGDYWIMSFIVGDNSIMAHLDMSKKYINPRLVYLGEVPEEYRNQIFTRIVNSNPNDVNGNSDSQPENH